MAIALVSGQTASHETSVSTTVVVTLPNNPTAGNLVVVAHVNSDSSGTVSCKDSNNNVYSLSALTPFQGTTPATETVGIFYLVAPANATKTITVTTTGATTTCDAFAAEFSGAVKSLPFEGDGTASQSSGSPSASITTPTLTTLNDGDLCVAACLAPGVISAATGSWALIGSSVGSGNWAEWQVQAAQGNLAVGYTQGSAGWAGIIAAFKAGPSEGSTPTANKGARSPRRGRGPPRGAGALRRAQKPLVAELPPPPPPQPVEEWGAWSSPDDPPYWQPRLGSNLALLLGKPVATAALWPANLDDHASWQLSFARNQALNAPTAQNPFAPQFAAADFPADESSSWQTRSPDNLTLVLVGGQPVAIATRWRDVDDPASWQYRTPYNLILTGKYTPVAAPSYTGIRAPDDAATWQWKLGANYSALGGFPVAAIARWRDVDDPASWQWKLGTNYAVNAPVAQKVFAPQFAVVPDDSSVWQWKLASNYTVNAPSTARNPFAPQFPASQDDSSAWQQQYPRNSSLLATSVTFNPAEAWGTWSSPDDLPFWQYASPYNLAMAASLEFLLPGISRSIPDDPPTWQWQPLNNLPLFPPSTVTFQAVEAWGTWVAIDDSAAWQWKLRANFALNPPTPSAPPQIFPQYRTGLDDAAAWQWRLPANFALNPPSAATTQFFGKQNIPASDDASVWQYRVSYNVGLLAAPQVGSQYRAWLDDAPPWQQPQPYNLPLVGRFTPSVSPPYRPITDEPGTWQQRQPYNLSLVGRFAGPQAFPQYRTGLDDAAFWQWQRPGIPLLFEPLPKPVAIAKRWNDDYDEAVIWRWQQSSNPSLYPPSIIPVVTSAEWIIRARRRGRR